MVRSEEIELQYSAVPAGSTGLEESAAGDEG